MKPRTQFINAVAEDAHITSQVKPEEAETSEESTKRIKEQNRHIVAINNALDKLLDGEMTPEEYLSIVSFENEKLSRP